MHLSVGENLIKFRPHHFLCTLCFQGKGYSPDFVKNYFQIIEDLPNTVIEIVSESDSICKPCPHNAGSSCTNEKKINSLDILHAAALNLNEGERITWDEAKQRIQKNIDINTFDRICDSCEWKPLGICAGVVAKLRDQGNK